MNEVVLFIFLKKHLNYFRVANMRILGAFKKQRATSGGGGHKFSNGPLTWCVENVNNVVNNEGECSST